MIGGARFDVTHNLGKVRQSKPPNWCKMLPVAKVSRKGAIRILGFAMRYDATRSAAQKKTLASDHHRFSLFQYYAYKITQSIDK